ncbi:unnamed protein product [Caenorhabditis brenneri]
MLRLFILLLWIVELQNMLIQSFLHNSTSINYSRRKNFEFGPPKQFVSVEGHCLAKDGIRLGHPTDRCVYFLGAVGEYVAAKQKHMAATLHYIQDQPAPALPVVPAPAVAPAVPPPATIVVLAPVAVSAQADTPRF